MEVDGDVTSGDVNPVEEGKVCSIPGCVAGGDAAWEGGDVELRAGAMIGSPGEVDIDDTDGDMPIAAVGGITCGGELAGDDGVSAGVVNANVNWTCRSYASLIRISDRRSAGKIGGDVVDAGVGVKDDGAGVSGGTSGSGVAD